MRVSGIGRGTLVSQNTKNQIILDTIDRLAQRAKDGLELQEIERVEDFASERTSRKWRRDESLHLSRVGQLGPLGRGSSLRVGISLRLFGLRLRC